jgi:hypothetical protein
VPPTPAKAMTPSPGMAHGPSFRPARPQSREKQTPPVRSRATKPCTHCGGGGGRIVRRQWSGHRRRRAKTGMPCMKLPGRRLSARDFARQVAELEVRVAVLNGLTAPADPSPTWRHKSAQGRERHKPQTTRATEPTATVVFWRQVTRWEPGAGFRGRVAAPHPEIPDPLVRITGTLPRLGCSLVRHAVLA